MTPDLEAVLTDVDRELDEVVEILTGFLREEGDSANTYTALVLALILMDPDAVFRVAFAGIVRAAKMKLAEDA
jgi:hypothetical protein